MKTNQTLLFIKNLTIKYFIQLIKFHLFSQTDLIFVTYDQDY